MLAVARDTEKDIDDVDKCARLGHDDRSEDPVNSSDRETYNSLPLLRVAVAWVFACRKELVECQEHLEPYVSGMHRALTRCLSVFMEPGPQPSMRSAPYLLPEDVETIGLASFDNWSALRLEVNGPYKPHYGEAGVERDSRSEEDLARIYDIIQCGTQLVHLQDFPWIATRSSKDGSYVTTVAYSGDHHALAAATGARVENQFGEQDPSQLAGDFSMLGTSESPPLPTAMEEPAAVQFHLVPLDSDLNVDLETYSRVETFLAPPEPETASSSWARGADSTAYGTGSSTAERVYGQPQPTSPALGSSRSKAFPGLPWDFVFTPTPQQSTLQNAPGRGLEPGRTTGGRGGRPRPGLSMPLDESHPQNSQTAAQLTADAGSRALPQTPDAKCE